MEIEENYPNRNKTSENMWYRNKKKNRDKKKMQNPQLFVNNEAGNTSLVFNNFLAEIF